MTPTENIIESAIQLGLDSGYTFEETKKILTESIKSRQNKYKWRLKIDVIYHSMCNRTGYTDPNQYNFLDNIED